MLAFNRFLLVLILTLQLVLVENPFLPGRDMTTVQSQKLTAFTSPSQVPLQITEILVSPTPTLGTLVSMHVEMMSSRDEFNTMLTIELPEGLVLISGDLTWQGSLTAYQSQAHEITFQVLSEGDWRIEVIAASILSEGGSYSDLETTHLIVSENMGECPS